MEANIFEKHYIYIKERHYIHKANSAQIVQVLGINNWEDSQEFELLKYDYRS
jgi:hypothetical protein